MANKRTDNGVGREANDEGFMLVAVIVMIFFVLLTLSVAAPRVARQLQHDREMESARRADQYVRAIRKYYLKFQHYPGSIEQLEKTNNQRFLRQKYLDPLTGKSDWRLIPVGKNKTKVKGFFGEDLPGMATGGLGSAAGMQSDNGSNSAFGGSGFGGGSSRGGGLGGSGGGLGGSSGGLGGSGGGLGGSSGSFGGAGGFGSSNNSPSGSSLGSSNNSAFGGSFGGASGTNGGNGSTGGSAAANGSQASGGVTGGSGIASQNATDYKGDSGPLMGIGSAKSGEAMLVVNEQTNYGTWEFLYDPRLEAMRAKGSLLGGGGMGGSGSGFGSNNNTNGSNGSAGSPFGGNGGSSPGGNGGSSPGGGFGTSTFGAAPGSGSSFGNPGGGTGFGSSGGSGSQPPPPTSPSTPP